MVLSHGVVICFLFPNTGHYISARTNKGFFVLQAAGYKNHFWYNFGAFGNTTNGKSCTDKAVTQSYFAPRTVPLLVTVFFQALIVANYHY